MPRIKNLTETMRSYMEILSEVPILIPGEMSTDDLDWTVPTQSLGHGYGLIGRFNDIDLFWSEDKSHVIGVDNNHVDNTPDRVVQVFRLTFKDHLTAKLPSVIKKPLQVDKVMVNRKYRRQDIATKAYEGMLKMGYSLMSDIEQYETAEGLWKYLALRNPVYIVDAKTGILSDRQGHPLRYDGTNIPDDVIWGNNLATRTLLLTNDLNGGQQ